MKKISVIMSIYSEPIEWISEAIDSILDQTFSDFELIIINDKPNREENGVLLSEYQKKDNRIVVVSNEENIGLTKSLNKGLKVAKGKYIARMDADDISLPTRFERQFVFMEENKDVVVCGANVRYFGKKTVTIEYPHQNQDFFIFIRNPFAHPTVMIRASVIKDNRLLYNENYRYAQDYEFWSRIACYGKFHNIQEILLKYRVDNQQISRSKLKEQQNLAGHIRRIAFDNFCEEKYIDFKLPQSIELNTIRKVKKIFKDVNLTVAERDAVEIFIYYLYRSTEKQKIYTLIYLLCSFDFLKLGLGNSLKVLACLFSDKYTKLVSTCKN